MPLQTINGTGAFDSTAASQINANFRAVSPTPDYWVRPQASSTLSTGSYTSPFASMALARPAMEPGVVIGLLGTLFEEVTLPLGVNDVTFLGMGGQPRQATTSGVPNGGGATWITPTAGATSTTTPLVIVRGQGTRFQNIYFSSSATAAPCVQLLMNGAGDPPIDASAEHVSFVNCYFTGADDGISSSGGPNFCTIDGCTFLNFNGTGDIGISSVVGAGVHSLQGWTIKNCEFRGNTRHIQAALTGASIHDNHFSYIYGATTTAIFYDATGGSDNAVYRNAFDVNSGNAGIAAMFVLGTNDRFSANSLSTAVTTTQYSWGDPA